MSKKEISKILNNLLDIDDYNSLAKKYNEQAIKFEALQELTKQTLDDADTLIRDTNVYYAKALKYYAELVYTLYDQKNIRQVKKLLDENTEEIDKRYQEFVIVQTAWTTKFGERKEMDDDGETEV